MSVCFFCMYACAPCVCSTHRPQKVTATEFGSGVAVVNFHVGAGNQIIVLNNKGS